MSRTQVSLLAGVFGLLACAPPPVTPGFDDHTRTGPVTVAEFEALATTAHGRTSGKFIITGFDTPDEGVRFVDARFYTLHDEWFWFRLLNGQRIPGLEAITPAENLHFGTITEVYAWAKTQLVLPLGLRWVDDGRLYSPRFYDLALFVAPRSIGVGTLVHVPASATRPERWGFMLEYVDQPTHAELTRFFEALERALPADVGPQVAWIVRSPQQEVLAQQLISRQAKFHDRILRLKDLTASGEVEIYNEGLTAGRLRLIKSGDSFSSATSTDILLLEDVPDFLPPAAGVITAVPQTPLAHFNLLAKNRGIPNAYLAGVADDQELHDLAWLARPVVLQVTGPNALVVKPLSEGQYAQWLRAKEKTPVAVTQTDVSALPYVEDLRALPVEQTDALRPSLGGKATGYLGLLAGAPEAAPDAIAAISIRPYVEHLTALRPRLEAMLAAPAFNADVRVRVLVLEGADTFLERYPDAKAWRDDFLGAHGAGDVLGDLVRAGGVKAVLRGTPMDSTTLTRITQALRARFGHYAVTQGLRFRSSSTAEDVEGFNGAGLYDSNTGYLDPAAQPDPGEQKRSVEWALKKTWASYWSSEAFEERAQEAIDHLSGNMAVVVHARFDDEKERSNGVFLFTLHDGAAVMDLNVQQGAVSVTNPTTTALPEIDRVSLPAGATSPVIERLRASTLAPAGAVLLTDAELLQTFERARRVSVGWLERENARRPAARRATTQVLDFEFRQVPSGWPALQTGAFPARIVLKQTRSLEPELRNLPAAVSSLPIPRDVLMRSRRVERRTCETAAFTAVLAEAFVDPLARPSPGHTVEPLTAQLTLTLKQDLGALRAGHVLDVDHLGFTATHPDLPAQWGVDVRFSAGAPVSALRLVTDHFRLSSADAAVEGASVSCTAEVLFSTPAELLLSFL